MRTLKYAILGMLNQKDMTGYDLTIQFESTLCEFWSARHSQIYPELKKLNEEGSITFETEITGTSLEKKLYHITEDGRADFMNWMTSDTELQATPKDISRLKIFFCDSLSLDEKRHLLDEQIHRHKARLLHLRQNQKKFNGIPKTESNELGDYLVLLGAIMREENYCEWLNKCIEIMLE